MDIDTTIGIGIDNPVKVIIIAAFFINAIYAKGGLARGRRDQIILIIAMGFTLLADSLMLLFGMNIAGILAFCVVQTMYNYRYTNLGRVIAQIILGGIAFVIAYHSGLDMLFSLGAAYAVFLFFSVTGSFMAYNKYPSPNNLMIVLGMLLFMACDIFVGIYNIRFGLDAEQLNLVFRGIWLCYFPAQALLSSSARKARNYKEEDAQRRENRG